ncbi:MAG: NUDIX hydrolase [Alphaproteobacteria bacterium]|jgi:8-oxo-dGTP diphosphatase|nr:NUDIX hydrolase [Alphaproteobacteria bacterium]HPQ50563.1 NUDIX hydrolase [Alphaproteobacteria bacterium]
MDEIKLVNLAEVDLLSYQKQLADCVVLTADNKLYMQRRPENWGSCSGAVNIFGGHVEQGETPTQAVIRELNEETGGKIKEQDLLFIGAITEGWTKHKEIVYVYFWHDKENTITGCYEAEPITFDSSEEALSHPKIMDYAKWALMECRNRNLIM